MKFFKGDRESLLTAMEDAGKITPNRTIAMKRVLPSTRPEAASTVAKGTSDPASRARSASSTSDAGTGSSSANSPWVPWYPNWQ